MIALASGPAIGHARSCRTAFLFTRVGLAGCRHGRLCALLPRVIGQGRAAELLFTGRSMSGGRGRALGLLQPHWSRPDELLEQEAVERWRSAWPKAPTSPTASPRTMLNHGMGHGPWSSAIEAEAQAQAICMQTADFERAYKAFVAKEKPKFDGD